MVVLIASFAAGTAFGADAVMPQPGPGPESAAEAPATAQQVPAAAASPEATASASEAVTPRDATTSQPNPSDPAPAEFKIPAGYKAVKRGLDTVYCKSEKPTGSRVPERVCYSREQLEAIERRTEQDRQNLKQMTRPLGNVSGG
ncbi:MAG: hypothetical protein MUO39_12165 [Steroidobacteraceae bacterium]|nr:hypothetical protein [Steroidobacteraceae bacterium]